MANFDFAGWATRNDLRCADGRIIRKDAFIDNDGMTVPLVWNHDHNSPENVLGHALLENRADGVYAYCTLNNSECGNIARELIKNGDISSMSIYANKLTQNGSSVLHGAIREVSLVLAGANPGALIETVLMHTAEDGGQEAIIYGGEEIEYIAHSDDDYEDYEEYEDYDEDDGSDYEDDGSDYEDDEYVETDDDEAYEDEEYDEGSDEEIYDDIEEDNDMYYEDEFEHGACGSQYLEHGEETVGDVLDTLDPKQKQIVMALIAMAMEKNGGSEMNHNVFEGDTWENTLSHSEVEEIFADAANCGTLKEACLQHGITDIEYLFPDAKDINNGAPDMYTWRDMGWVSTIMNGVHHTPFSRIRSIFADISADDARAKGYMQPGSVNTTTGAAIWDTNSESTTDWEGTTVEWTDNMSGQHRAVTRDNYGNFSKQKLEEVFTVLRRTTGPTTIYKLQKFNRDDLVDITDFDVVAWVKKEMRMMLDEEVARAILLGDGRAYSAADKIDENCIRPIYSDNTLYTLHCLTAAVANQTTMEKAREFIKGILRTRRHYFGSGNLTLFITEDLLTELLLIEDLNKHRLYKSEEELCTAMRVKKIVTVPEMAKSRFTRTEQKTESGTVYDYTYVLDGILVDLADYNVGTDRKGQVELFDDFDIDYNKYEYMMETRMSGALTKPRSAMRYETYTKTEHQG